MLDHSVSDEPGILVPNRAGLVNMEELSLKALLECPLCLEQLDVSAKVLPCQHTFCKLCLQSHETGQSQLLCPECQTPAQARTAEELPTNLLLVRLLEGLQGTSGPERNKFTPRPQPLVEDTGAQQQEGLNYERKGQSEVFLRPSMQTQRGNVSDDSVFISGNSVSLKPQADEDAEYGYPDDSRQRVYLPLSGSLQTTSQLPLCRALCDFNPQEMNLQDGQYCLSFLKGDILTFIRRVDEHWIEARQGAKIGICPLQYLEPGVKTQ